MSELSPLLRGDCLVGVVPAGFPCCVVWGEWESSEFKRQSQEMAQVGEDIDEKIKGYIFSF